MLKTGILVCVIAMATAGAVPAAEVIEVEKLSKQEFKQQLRAASDDTVIEYKGERKTKAEWRSHFQAQFKPIDAAKLKQMAEEHKAKLEAQSKALRDEQNKRVAEENAQITKEFEEFDSH